MTSSPTSITVEQFLSHPPARVWQALTDPEQLARWLMPNTFTPKVGHRFTFDAGSWGDTHCEVLALEPQRLLRISWRNDSLDTVVTWRLVPEGSGTRLLLEHSGFDTNDEFQRAAHEAMEKGWRVDIAQALDDVLGSAR
jgi:uncharacterized protein YndB with AHSA1/START domain